MTPQEQVAWAAARRDRARAALSAATTRALDADRNLGNAIREHRVVGVEYEEAVAEYRAAQDEYHARVDSLTDALDAARKRAS